MMLWIATAFAAGFYHPDDVAAASALFAKASATSGPAFEERSRKAEGFSRALQDYEEALDLLGPLATPGERARYESLKDAYNRQFAVLDRFATTMMEDFDHEFQAGLARAVKAAGGATECKAMITEGRPLPGIPARTKPNPDCKGDNLNAKIAASMDADPALQKAVREITALAWPDVTLDVAPQTVQGERWVSVTKLFHEGARDALRDIDRQDDEAREPFAVAIENGASVEDKKKLVAQAEAVTAATAKRRAALGAPVLQASAAAFAKWSKKGEPATGFCANPALLGGCAGADASAELVPRLLAEKKVAAALP